MDEKKPASPSVLVAALALILVVVILLCVFAMGQAGSGREGIILPTAQTERPEDASEPTDAGNRFVQVHTDNIEDVLRSMQKTAHYQQSFEITLGTETAATRRTVDLWVSGRLIHGQVDDGRKVKTILTDGDTAWIWYDVDPEPVSITLDGSILIEDLLGLPNFDYLRTLRRSEVTDADYLFLNEPEIQCIFFGVKADDGADYRYWISLDNGLIYQADTLRDGELVYQVREKAFSMLAESDSAFQGKFMLPDGTEPFTAAARMLPP